METSALYSPSHLASLMLADYDPDRNAKLYAERKRIRDKRVQAVENALRKNGIPFQQTEVEHVVTISIANAPKLYLSLKSRSDERGYTFYLYRIAGTDKWCSTRRDDFLAWLRHPSKLLETMPMGKFKGESLALLLVTCRWHLEWWYKAEFPYPANLRHTITTLLGQYPVVLEGDEVQQF